MDKHASLNKLFRLVWSAAHQCWVAVAEHTSARGKSAGGQRQRAALRAAIGAMGAIGAVMLGGPAQAAPPVLAPHTLPTNGQVTAGTATVSSSGSAMTIQQSTPRAVVQWDTFNVGSNAQVTFQQPSAQSATLNRVLDNNPSQIAGRISANGQVVISNPNGVLFTPGARVDVGSLTATTHSIGNADFMAGLATYQRNGATGAVVNQGQLRAALGGYVALLAPEVRNEGVVIAQAGTVVLAAGEAIRLDFGANGSLLGITATPSQVRALVENKQAVYAPGGLIVLSARAVDTLQGALVRNSGTLSASSLVSEGGRIVLAGDEVQLTAGSRTEATGATRGGQIEVQGHTVQIAGTVDVSGAQGGRIDIQATGPVQLSGVLAAQGTAGAGGSVTAQTTRAAPASAGLVLAAGAHINVTGATDGGSVQLQAPGIEMASASVDASGDTGTGGQVQLTSTSSITVVDSRVRADGAQSGGVITVAASHDPLTPADAPGAPPHQVALLGSTLLGSSSRRGRGGNIQLTGNDLLLDGSTTLDATGATGGGQLLVGGGWQGGGGLPQATTVQMGTGVTLDASATTQGNGGTIVLWSDVHNAASLTTATGVLRARGGAQGGNGGQIETSGHQVALEGLSVNAGAASDQGGTGGLWYIDPADATITQSIANGYAATLNTGTSVLNDVAGTITWNTGVTLAKTAGGNATLTLRTGGPVNGRDIDLGNAQISSSAGALNLVIWTRYNNITYSGRVLMNGASINTNGGHLFIGGGNATTWNGLAVGDGSTATWATDQRGIYIRDSSITTGGGNVLMSGTSHDTGSTAGITNSGLQLDGAVTISSGSGSITLQGNLLGRYSNGTGLRLGGANAGDIAITSTSGAITLEGRGSDQNGSGWRHALLMISDSATNDIAVRSTSGTITVDGRGTYSTGNGITDSSGLQIQTSFAGAHIDIVSSTGAINVIAENTLEGAQYANALRLTAADAAGSIRIGYDGSTAYSGNISIGADSILQRFIQSGAGSIALRSTGTLTIAPRGSSFTAHRAEAAGTLSFDNDWDFGSTLTGFTLGSATSTQALTLSNALTVAGPISLYGGHINLNANLTSTAAGAAILAKGTGDVIQSGNTTVTTNGGAVTYWADSDNSGSGGIQIGSSTTAGGIDSRTSADRTAATHTTGGGRITLAGGLDDGGTASGIAGGTASDGIPDGYATNVTGMTSSNAGVLLGTDTGSASRTNISLLSGGGHITLQGRSTQAINGLSLAVQSYQGLTVNAGTTGNINLVGRSTISSGAASAGSDLASWRQDGTSSGDNVWRTVNGNISLIGTATGGSTENLGLAIDGDAGDRVQFIASGTGTITVNGTATGTSASGVRLRGVDMLASSGAISVIAPSGAVNVSTVGVTLGQKASTPVTASSSNLLVRADSLTLNSTLTAAGTGRLTVEPSATSFSSAFNWSSSISAAGTLTGLTLGKAGNTANLTLGNATSIAGPISLYGGNITVNAALTSTAAGQGILAKGTGAITAGANLTTNAGDITLWANSAGATTGGIQVSNNVTLSSTGGAITLGGSAGSTTIAGLAATSANGTSLPQGYAQNFGSSMSGVLLGTDNANNGQDSTVALNSGNGKISIAGQSSQYASALSIGVLTYAGVNVNAGTGDITLNGLSTGATGGNADIGFTLAGFFGVASAPSKWQTNGGTIVMNGTSSGATGTAIGADPQGGTNGTAVTIENTSASSGSITINGSASNGTSSNIGVRTWNTHILSRSGAITLNAQGASGSSYSVASSYTTTLGFRASSDVTSATGNIAITADALGLAGTLNVNSTGALTAQSNGTSFTSAQTTTNLNLSSGLTGLTLGKATNTADVTLSSAIGIAGPITVYGGNLTVNGNLSSTASGAAMLLKGSGNIAQATSVAVTSNGGNVTYWADSDNSGAGYIEVPGSTSIDTRTASDRTATNTTTASGGGRIVLAGGLDNNSDGIPDGYATATVNNHAGLQIGAIASNTTGATLYSGGGDMIIRARSTGTAGSNQGGRGLTIAFQNQLNAGTGTISLEGTATNAHGIEIATAGSPSSANAWNLFTAAGGNATTAAIRITGSTGAGGFSGLQVGFDNTSTTKKSLFQAVGTGGIDISVDKATLNAAGFLSASGPISLQVGTGNTLNVNAVTGSGQLTSTYFGACALSDCADSLITASSWAVTISADTFSVSSSIPVRISTSGAFTLRPTGNDFSSALNFSSTLWSLSGGVSGLTLGKASSADGSSDVAVTLATANTVAGPISVYGSNLTVSASQTSTASGVGILLKGSGNITVAASTTLSTNGGNLTLWADSDASGAGGIAVNNSVTLDSRTSSDRGGSTHTTGGGAITLGGGLDDGGSASGASSNVSGLVASDGRPDGYAVNYGSSNLQYGILLGTEAIGSGQNSGIRVYSGSGDIRLQGLATTQSGVNGASGILAYQGLGMNAGSTGDLTLLGVTTLSTGTTANAMDLQAWRSTSGAASTLQTADGDIVIVAAGSGGSTSNAGLNVQANDATRSMSFVATGSGHVTLDGRATGIAAIGTVLSGVSALSASGSVDVLARAGGVLFNNFPAATPTYLGAQSGSLVTSSSANITLTADTITFNTPVSALSTGTMTVQPFGTSFASALTWPISGLTLGSISGLTLGKSTNTADITIASATSVAGPIAVYGGNLAIDAALTATGSNTITLQGSGNVTDGSSGYVSAANLRLLGGNVTLDSSSNAIGTLAASGVSGLSYLDSNALTLGTVGGTNGLSASGAVNIATLTGNLAVTQNVATSSTNATAIMLNAGRTAAAGSTSGGDLTVSNGVTVTTGSGGGARLYGSSIAASTGLITLAGAGSGRFRYGSDETTTNYTAALPTGIAVIYREAPTATVSAVSESLTYGSTPTLAMQLDLSTGDTVAQAFATAPSLAVSGSVSTAGRYTVGSHTLTPSGGTQRLGYGSVQYSNGTLTVGQRVLNVTYSGTNKAYDATTTTSVGTSDDRVSGDSFTILRSTSFADANAANGLTVNVTGVSLSGTDAANYSVASTGATSANISPYVINLSGGRVYDGTNTVAASLLSMSTLVGSQTVVLSGSGNLADRHVGSAKTVGLGSLALSDGTNGGLASNYTLVGGTHAANITAAALTLSASNVTKTYDGGTTASGTAVVTSGQLFGSDSLSGGSFAFVGKNVGTGKTVNVSGVTVNDGNSGGDYVVSYAANTSSTINAAAITLSTSDVSKTYDGTTTASGSAVVSSGQLFGSDSLSGGSFDFADRNASSGKTVNVSGVTVADGNSGGNYIVSYAANTSSTISAAALTLSTSDVSKTYDGTTAAAGSAVVTAGQLFGSDSITGGSFGFANKNAGSGKTVSVSGVTVSDGNSGGNYTVTYADNTSSTISAAALILSTSNVTKTYDGTTAATGSAVVATGQLFSGDSLSGGSFAFADKNAGSNKTVNVSGVTVSDGNSGGNYVVSYADNTHSTINAAALTLSTSDVSKTYDGTTTANGSAVVTTGQLFGSDFLSGGSFAFADKNAGSNKTVNVSSVSVNDGHSGGNYVVTYADNTSSTISAAALTLSTSDVSKTYDGTTTANGSAVVTSGQLFSGDSLSGGNFAFADRNAGSGKTVTVSSVSVNDGNSSGNYVVSYADNTSSTINAAAITLSSSDVTKTYDGTTTANGSAVVTAGQLYGSDSLSGGSFAFANRHAGSGKTVNVSGVTVSDGHSGDNYAVTYADNTSSTISAAALTLSSSDVIKTYDGTTAATGSAVITAGQLYGSDSISGGSFAFANKNAGSGKTVNVSGVSVNDGNNGGDYAVTYAANTSSTINAATLTLSSSDVSKTYDGTTAANGSAVVAAGQLFSGDSLSGGSFAFADRNAGSSKTVSVSGVTVNDSHGGGNYVVSYADNTGSTINAAAITLSSSNVSKTYDGTTSANGSVVVSAGQLFGSDALSGGSFAFADRNAGGNKTVNVSGVTVSDGYSGGNYVVSYAANTASAINAAALSLSSTTVSKTYDGTTAANGSAVITAGQLFGSDSIAGGSFAFADKNAGSGKTVNVSSVTVSDGNSGGNYAISYAANTQSTINAAALTLSISDISKTYDGSTAASGSAVVAAGQLFSGDTLSGGTFSFSNKNAGSNKTVNVSGVTVNDGHSGGNYVVSYTANTHSTINAAAITLSSSDVSKTYDGTTTASGSAVVTAGQLFGSDSLSGGSFAFADKNAGNNKTVNTSGVTLSDGNNGGNYAVSYAANTHSTINAAALTLSSSDISKTYDGSTAATGSAVVTAGQLFGSDSLSGGSFSFADKNVDSGKTVNVSGVTVTDGSNGGNYVVSYVPNTQSAITPKLLTLTTAPTVAGKVYDGSVAATVTDWGHVDTGIAGETLTLTGTSAQFTTPNAGLQKPVTVSGYALGNASGSASNYTLATTTASTNADITKAVLSIVANNDAKFVSMADATGYNGVSITGFVNAETSAVLGGAASVVRHNPGQQAAGTYHGELEADVSGLTATNYSFTTRSGDYTIVPSNQLLVRAANVASTYGDTAPYSLTSAAYFDGSNVHTLQVNAGATPGSFTVSDGAGGSAAFTLVPAGAGRSSAGYVTIGAWQLAASDLHTVNAQNFSDTLTVVGAHTVAQRTLTAQVGAGLSKVYDGTTGMTGVHIDLAGAITGDVLSTRGTGTFASRNAGSGLDYTINGITVSGLDAGNYVLAGGSSLSGHNGVITPRALAVEFSGVDRVYDGHTGATFLSTDNRISGDLLSVRGTALFTDKNVGTAKTVALSDLALSGADAGNYTLVSSSAHTTASITRLDSVTWVGGANGDWFDPANWAGGAIPDLANVSRVIIPNGVTVRFDTSAAVAPAETGPVQLDGLGTAGSLQMRDGVLDVGTGGMTLAGFEQSGGSFSSTGAVTLDRFAQTGGSAAVTGSFTVNSDFSQGSQGTLAVGGDLQISDTEGGVQLGQLRVHGALGVTSLGGDITQAAGTSLWVVGSTALNAGSAAIRLDNPGNDFQGSVSARGGDIRLADDFGGLVLADIHASTLNVISRGGSVTQQVGTVISVDGLASLSAPGGLVDLPIRGNRYGQLQTPGSDYANQVMGKSLLRPALLPPPESVRVPLPQDAPPLLDVAPTVQVASAGSPRGMTVEVTQLAFDGLPRELTITVDREALLQGFSVTLPESLTGDGLASARRENGQALPDWLDFDPAQRSFTAAAVPPRRLPLRMTVIIGGRQVTVVLQAGTARASRRND